MRLRCQRVVNCAGLGAQNLAVRLIGVPPETVPPRRMCKGNYFALTGRSPFARLVYPVPDNASLGVHYTLDLAGQGRFGPDVRMDRRGKLRRSIPRAPTASMKPFAATGPVSPLARYGRPIRASASNWADPKCRASDFRIDGPREHGVAGLIICSVSSRRG